MMQLICHTNLTAYDYGIRFCRGGLTAAMSVGFSTLSLSLINKVHEICSETNQIDSFKNIVPMASIAVISASLAFKCATRVVKETRALFLEKQMALLLKNQIQKDSILILQAKRDWSGDTTCQTRSTLKIFKTLSKSYSLFHEKIESVDDINSAITKLLKKQKLIKAVIIIGHGKSGAVMLGGSKQLLDPNTSKQIDFKSLEGTKMIFLTCFGGLFAKKIQEIAGPNVSCEGSSTVCGPRCFKIDQIKPISFKFVHPLTNQDTTIKTSYKGLNEDEQSDIDSQSVDSNVSPNIFLSTAY